MVWTKRPPSGLTQTPSTKTLDQIPPPVPSFDSRKTLISDLLCSGSDQSMIAHPKQGAIIQEHIRPTHWNRFSLKNTIRHWQIKLYHLILESRNFRMFGISVDSKRDNFDNTIQNSTELTRQAQQFMSFPVKNTLFQRYFLYSKFPEKTLWTQVNNENSNWRRLFSHIRTVIPIFC